MLFLQVRRAFTKNLSKGDICKQLLALSGNTGCGLGRSAEVLKIVTGAGRWVSSDKTDHQEVRREKVATVPNLLCLTRMAAAPCIAHAIVHGHYNMGLGLFVFAGLTDLVDGWIARNVPGQMSTLGSFLDPLADKVLMTCGFLSLTCAGLLPAPLACLAVSRDLLLTYGALHVRFMSVVPPFTIGKLLDFSLPTIQILPTKISKINTVLQMSLVTLAIASPVFDSVRHPSILCLSALTAVTTLASSASYAFSPEVFRFNYRSHDHQYSKRTAVFIFYVLLNAGFLWAYPMWWKEPTLT